MENVVQRIVGTVEGFGGSLIREGHSAISISTYLKFDGIPVQMPKSKRRAFFARFPRSNGAGVEGRFSVRISDHQEVSCREASMFNFRVDRDTDAQIAELREMLEFLTDAAPTTK